MLPGIAEFHSTHNIHFFDDLEVLSHHHLSFISTQGLRLTASRTPAKTKVSAVKMAAIRGASALLDSKETSVKSVSNGVVSRICYGGGGCITKQMSI